MLLDEIGGVLSTGGVASSSGPFYLWLGQLPDSTVIPDRAVAILETGGYAPEARAELDRPTFQVLTRGAAVTAVSTAYEEARTKAEAVKTALHALAPGTYSGRHYGGVWAEQDPIHLGLDDSDRPLFSQNFRAMRSRT